MAKRRYSLRDSPFFRLRSKGKLARLLQVSPAKLKKIAQLEGGYIQFKKPKKKGGSRDICAPIPPLKSIQSRIADLLGRVAPPDYLFAPVEGRSYVDNAARHIGARAVRLLDIEDFFPSCTIKKVIWFFRTHMECSPDVAVILARIVTHNDVLPQGSPCSPILAYFAYVDMWEEVDSLVSEAGCKLSVYADDLTISGGTVPEAMIWEIKKTLFRHGHRYAVHKERARRDRATEITGVILTHDGVTAPNRQRQKIHAVRENLKVAKSSKQAKQYEAQLRGRLAQLRQIHAGNTLPDT
ncbi:Reverse transcriptase (RNA-dependent DNA polymerase) [Thalassovita litoralis]|uniref:Reverse transcriptase (RNA-dependent DNA polymerase) n=1 Tax=Thalassovita litoralis TaxID=1010611 RepID=A0A521FC84_9RHOB|nr:reverse transcriptase family protein [Thalassovita litoralis]SMO93110.1 Reverse transcriptase (RNA-dependent DNA polymerase) [Thalassovita litoralis]